MARTPKGRASTNVQKPYSDDKNKGRRTGRTVKEGHRDSDGWEDFEDMWRLNDASPRAPKRAPETPRKSYAPDFDRDDSFDMSIVQEEPDTGPSPSAYITATSPPAPSSVRHTGSLNLRLDVPRSRDFDAIPSPRKILGPIRSNHSHSLSTDLSASRDKLGARPKPKPKPKPVYKPQSPSPIASPEPEVVEENNISFSNDTPADVPSPSPSPLSRRKSQHSLSKKNHTQTDDDDDEDGHLLPASPVRPSKAHKLAGTSPKPRDMTQESGSEGMDASVRSAKSQAQTPSSRSRQSIPAPEVSDAEVESPARNKTTQKVTTPATDDDDSGPEDDFGAPFDGGNDQMDTDFGFAGNHRDDNAYEAAMDVEADPVVDRDDERDDEQPDEPEQNEEDSEEEERAARKAAKEKKKKQKSNEASTSRRSERAALSPVVEEDEDMEDDIAAGLQAVGSDGGDDDEPVEPEVQPRPKKARSTKTAKPPSYKRRGTSALPEGHLTMGDSGDKENMEGVRRSTRRRHKPLEYWRGERIILGRSEEGPAPCPVFKGFLEVPKEPSEPLGQKRKKSRGARSTSRTSRAPSSRRGSEDPEAASWNAKPPEDGWDDDTPVEGKVVDFETQEEQRRRLAFTSKQIEPEPAVMGAFSFRKLFGDADFIASGVISFPVGGMKPGRGSKDNTYVFFVHTGAVQVTIHTEEITVAVGGTFIVPRGNHYEISNIADRETVLFFAQARKVPIENDDDDDGEGTQTAGRRSVSSLPRYSTGPPRSPASGLARHPRGSNAAAAPSTYRTGSTASPARSQLSSISPTKHSNRGRQSTGRAGGR